MAHKLIKHILNKSYVFTSTTGALIGWVICVGGREPSRLWVICTGVPVIHEYLIFKHF